MRRFGRFEKLATIHIILGMIGLAAGWAPAQAAGARARQLGADLLLVDVSSRPPAMSAGEDLPLGFHRLTGSDLPLLQEVGRPELPYRTLLVGLPEGRAIQVMARSLEASRLGAYRLAPYVPRDHHGVEAELSAEGETAPVMTRSSLEAAEDPAVYEAAGVYPARLAVVHSIGVLRDQAVAEVRVYPVQYSASDYELTHHGRIEVRIRFVSATGAAAEALGAAPPAGRMDPVPGAGPEHLRVFDAMLRDGLINYDMIAKDRARRRAAAAGSLATDSLAPGSTGDEIMTPPGSPAAVIGGPGTVKVSVIQDGLYQVTPAMLTAAGVDVSMLDPQTFHMTSGGVDVPILVDGEGDHSFDPTDRVIFFGVGIKNDRYTKTNVYYLSFNGTAGPRMATRSGAFTGGATTPASFVTTAHAEVNINYTQRVRAGVTEAWYWGLQLRGDPLTGTLNYPITLDRVDPAPHTIAARARYLGLTDGQHTPQLLLNGNNIVQNQFAGQMNHTQTGTAASSILVNGANTMTVTLVNNGNFNDRVATDYFEVDYRRTYAVDGDQLLFDGEGVGAFHFALSNLGSSSLVLADVTASGTPVAITIPGGQISAGPPFTASFEDTLPSDRAYAISTRAALRSPAAVTLDIASSLRTPANGADYIIITDRSLLSAMQPLATFRASQGLRTKIVATDDIYDEFNFGRSNPSAIRDFMAYAYTTWSQLPAPAYVVLAGDGHFDYTDNFGGGAAAPEIVPPTLRNIAGREEASDNDYVAVVGPDVLPEMFVGRLPIRTASDAATIIGNIMSYETSPPVAGLNDKSLYVADNNDPIFAAILDNLQAFMPATMMAAEAYLPGGDPNDPPSQAQVDATTDTVFNNLNAGMLTAIYLGHGSVALWASEGIVVHNPNPLTGPARLDMNRLTNSGNQTFLVALNCINGYFADLIPAGPGHVDYSLAEEFVRRSNRGAIASWAPSALGQLTDYDSISYELFSHLFTDRMTTVGPLTVAALIDAVNIFGVSTNNISSMHLFGDPASRLALDSDNDGLVDYRESAVGSDPLDGDTDDDGLSDGNEVVTRGTSPVNGDTDGDLIKDGTEAGVTAPGPGTDTGSPNYVPDADPLTTTNPLVADTDGGGTPDGAEDTNRNGRIDTGETNPNNPSDDVACSGPLTEVQNLVVTRVGADVVLTWDVSSVSCATYQVLAATNAPFPKSSFAPFAVIGTPATAGFTHVGAAASANQYDYLVRIVHPQLGLGPLGAYGQ